LILIFFIFVIIRPENDSDRAGVRAVNESAFASSAEADLVDALRRQATPLVSLVAEDNGSVIGHVMFSPVALSSRPDLELMGLGPMAVAPEWQREGVGSALVEAGLDACLQLGTGAVVVLGHPDFYPRFGFERASDFSLRCAYDAPDEAFMAIELSPACLRNAGGLIRYHAAFADV
jgi:putative acetyltransferase